MNIISQCALLLILSTSVPATQDYVIKSERLDAGGTHTVLGSLPNSWSSGLCSTRGTIIEEYPGGERIELGGDQVIVFRDVANERLCAEHRNGEFFLAPPGKLGEVSRVLGTLTRVDAKMAGTMCFALGSGSMVIESIRLYAVVLDDGMIVGKFRLETSSGGVGLELGIEGTTDILRSETKCELLPS